MFGAALAGFATALATFAVFTGVALSPSTACATFVVLTVAAASLLLGLWAMGNLTLLHCTK